MDATLEQYRCPICSKLMIDACQTINCKHRFCEHCMKGLFNRTGRSAICPLTGCGSPLRDGDGRKYYPDRPFQKEVRNLDVKCQLNGCEWNGKFKDVEDHNQQVHPSYVVKPVKSSEATHVMVDKKNMEATHSMHQYLKKLVGDVSHTADLLGGAFQSQQTMETFVVVRKSVDAHHQSAAQSTASLGPADQPILKEPSLTLNAERPSFHSILKTDPEVDTASLTQADQAMIFFSGNNTNDHAHMEGHDNHPTMHHNTMSTATSCDQSAAAACAQTGTEKSSKRRKKSIECREPSLLPLIKGAQTMLVEPTRQAVTMPKSSMSLPPMMVSQYTQTMADDIPPPVPPKRKHKSATIPQQRSKQDTLPPLGHVHPPLTTGLSSCTSTRVTREETSKSTTSTAENPELCKRQLAVVTTILKAELGLNTSTQAQYPSNSEESRRRLHSVPSKILTSTNRK